MSLQGLLKVSSFAIHNNLVLIVLCTTNYHRSKTIQLSLSLILLLWAIIQGFLQIKQKQQTRYNYIIIAFVILSLISNIFFCLWNQIYELYSLETLFNNLYFLAIVGFVMSQYISKRYQLIQRYRMVYVCIIAVTGLLFFFIFVDSIIQDQNINQNSCQEIWYLCINGQCLLLAFIAVLILIINQIEQHQKLKKFLLGTEISHQVNNPLKVLWTWIGINIISQICNLIESGFLLNANPSNSCRIIDNQVSNSILMLLFIFLNMYLGYLATLLYFGYQRRKNSGIVKSELKNIEIEYSEYDSAPNNSNKIQLILPQPSL